MCVKDIFICPTNDARPIHLCSASHLGGCESVQLAGLLFAAFCSRGDSAAFTTSNRRAVNSTRTSLANGDLGLDSKTH